MAEKARNRRTDMFVCVVLELVGVDSCRVVVGKQTPHIIAT
jgi:hypothetical protein